MSSLTANIFRVALRSLHPVEGNITSREIISPSYHTVKPYGRWIPCRAITPLEAYFLSYSVSLVSQCGGGWSSLEGRPKPLEQNLSHILYSYDHSIFCRPYNAFKGWPMPSEADQCLQRPNWKQIGTWMATIGYHRCTHNYRNNSLTATDPAACHEVLVYTAASLF